MRCTRTQLRRMLDALRSLDGGGRGSEGGSPYFGLQWTDDGGLAAFRSSSTGIVRTLSYRESSPFVVASFAHLGTSLDAVRSDEFVLESTPQRGSSSGLRLRAEGIHAAEMYIHTVRPEAPWRKKHVIGNVFREYDPGLFRGIDLRNFPLRMPPTVKNGKMLLATDSGMVVRHGIASSIVFPYPRETFLRAIYGRELTSLFLTSEGYWGAVTDGYEVLVAGHRLGDSLFDRYDLPLPRIAEIPAPGLMSAMSSVVRWADRGARVDFNPKKGVISTRDEYHNPGEFTFGPAAEWEGFSIDYPRLKLLADAFVQSTEESVGIVHNSGDCVRLVRGPWEVNLRVSRSS